MTTSNESKTQRTDEEERISEKYDGEEIPGFTYVDASFARTLETELAEANAQVITLGDMLTSETDSVERVAHKLKETRIAHDLLITERDQLKADKAFLQIEVTKCGELNANQGRTISALKSRNAELLTVARGLAATLNKIGFYCAGNELSKTQSTAVTNTCLQALAAFNKMEEGN